MVTLSLSLFSLLPFLFFLSHSHFFLFSVVCLHRHHLEGDGSRGSWIVVNWVSSTLSLQTQTSLIKSGLSLPISLDGGDAVLVAWSWQWWHEGRGLWGCGLWVLWHGFLLGCRVVRWLWRGGGVVTGHGSIWVVGCRQGIDVDGAWCVAGNSSLCLFFHSPILSLLYFSHFDSVSQIGFWFWLDLESDREERERMMSYFY